MQYCHNIHWNQFLSIYTRRISVGIDGVSLSSIKSHFAESQAFPINNVLICIIIMSDYPAKSQWSLDLVADEIAI